MKKLSQKRIAQHIRVSEASISLILNGKRNIGWKTAKKIALFTGTDPTIWMESPAEYLHILLESKNREINDDKDTR